MEDCAAPAYTRYIRGCRCDACRHSIKVHMREYRRRRSVPATCCICGVVWSAAPGVTLCLKCSAAGAAQAAAKYFDLQRASHKVVVHVPGPPPERCDIPWQHPARRPYYDPRPPAPRVFCTGPCAWCGTTFTVMYQTNSCYCSLRCARGAGRRRRGYSDVARKVRLAVYKRDQWVCQLCHQPVDPTLPITHVWSATLDHIECVSWALIPDHSMGNLRLAHRMCNSIRGDETWAA